MAVKLGKTKKLLFYYTLKNLNLFDAARVEFK